MSVALGLSGPFSSDLCAESFRVKALGLRV